MQTIPSTNPMNFTSIVSRLAAVTILSPIVLANPVPSIQGAPGVTAKSDFVFIIDATGSMSGEISAVRSGLSGFVSGLTSFNVDSRFAIALVGDAPELILDFTSDITVVQTAFDTISVTSAVAGFQNNHNINPESTLEAIRQVLGDATVPLNTDNLVGHNGTLVFRPDARKNLIVVTDEDSDRPFHLANQFTGQNGNEPPSTCPILDLAWQAEVDAAANAAIANAAFVNLLINPGNDPSRCQFGDPASDVSDADFLNFNPIATLNNLTLAGHENSLQGQLLSANLIGRTFNISDIDDPDFVDNFFAAKIEENNPFFFCVGSACPCGNDAMNPVAGCANSTGMGALLSTSGTVSANNDDLTLTVSNVPLNQFGIILFGPGSQACSIRGDGFVGIQPGPPGSIMFLSIDFSGGTGELNVGPGIIADALAQFGPMGTILSGDTWFFQGFYRDNGSPSPCGTGFNFSNAIGVRFSN